MRINNHRRRLKAVFLFFFIFLFFSIARLIYIQFFRSSYLAELAKKQHNFFVELEPRRGTIFDANLRPLAINLAVDSVYACPKEMSQKDKENATEEISSILGISKEYLREKLAKDKYFVWLARKIPADKSNAIREKKLKGIDFLKETKRSYHNGYLASHVIGFAGLDNTGLDGLELYYNKYLRGQPGWSILLRDARQKKIDINERLMLPRDGYDLVLTIDEVIQYIAERELDKAYEKYKAKGATIIVMNPHTGAILALANRPTFDLNDYSNTPPEIRRNRALTDLYEPGSVFKIVTAAAAIEEGKVSEEDIFFCENGSYKFGPHILHDHRPHGNMTFQEVIEQSSNIGTSKVAQVIGADLLYRYIRSFGFGAKTNIDMAGEINGVAREVRYWSKISIVTIPMGQEVGVTSLQLAAAISVIANGGQLMRPYIVKEIKDKKGERIKDFSPQMIRKVISADTAERVKNILTGVVERGTGKLAKVSGFSSAGKTGTAQKIEENGRYSHSKFMASFIGFAPVEDPQIAVVVVLDEPRPYYFGGVVAAPVFKNVTRDTLRYLNSKGLMPRIVALNEDK